MIFILGLFLLLCSGCEASNQSTLDYMASNLHVKYTMEHNYPINASISLRNSGQYDIPKWNWQLYFSHMRLITGSSDPNGTELSGSGLRVYHENGYVYKMEPMSTFNGFPRNTEIKVYFRPQFYQVARTDIFPNWYVTGQGLQSRTLTHTATESLDFVSDFDNAGKWKRGSHDKYDPYTPEHRYSLNTAPDGANVDLGRAAHHVLPTPVEDTLNDDQRLFLNTGDWVVVKASQDVHHEANYLAEQMNIRLVNATDRPASRYIEVKLTSSLTVNGSQTTNQEAYILEVKADPDHLVISGLANPGLFYGVQSLLSLLGDPDGVPVGTIKDQPRFPYRGMHIDVSRNFRTKDEMLLLLDGMATYKLNKFHFHLTDDEGWRLEIPGLPELTEVGGTRCHDLTGRQCISPQLGSGPDTGTAGTGYYTVADYQQILQFAKDRHIQVVPEFDMPGHGHAPIKAMEARYYKYRDTNLAQATQYLLSDLQDKSDYLSVQKFKDNAISPCIESTYTFVNRLVEQLKLMHNPIQPLGVFNFGGDEVASGAWVGSPACQNFSQLHYNTSAVNNDRLKEHFVRRVAVIANNHGMGLAGWEDGLSYHNKTPYDVASFPNQNLLAYAWSNVWEWGNGHRTHDYANVGYKVIMSHATHYYFDHPHEPDPEERGLYWATRFSSTKKAFSFVADDIYKNIGYDVWGTLRNKTEICNSFPCPLLNNKANVLGVQGQLWSEVVRQGSHMFSQIFPRLLTLAERAWHQASWELIEDKTQRAQAMEADWQKFTNTLGYKELQRLDDMGIPYRVPPPGARLQNTYTLEANCEHPGLTIQYSTDGQAWNDLTQPQEMPGDATVTVRVKSADGARSGRAVSLQVPAAQPQASTASRLTTTMFLLALLLLATNCV